MSSQQFAPPPNNRYVYAFGEGDTKDKFLLGGKGCGLGEMKKIGLRVPPGYTIVTHACVFYSQTGKHPQGLDEECDRALDALEKEMGKKLGGEGKNGMLLLSVRSGAAMSMPGMMDTVLNLGLNDASVKVLAKLTKNERFAYDSYRRFISMFGDVVMGVHSDHFEHELHERKEKKRVKYDTELTAQDLKELCEDFKRVGLS